MQVLGGKGVSRAPVVFRPTSSGNSNGETPFCVIPLAAVLIYNMSDQGKACMRILKVAVFAEGRIERPLGTRGQPSTSGQRPLCSKGSRSSNCIIFLCGDSFTNQYSREMHQNYARLWAYTRTIVAHRRPPPECKANSSFLVRKALHSIGSIPSLEGKMESELDIQLVFARGVR